MRLGQLDGARQRLRLDPTTPVVPEISANKYVLNIRFLTQSGPNGAADGALATSDPRPRTADWNVAFELTFCNL